MRNLKNVIPFNYMKSIYFSFFESVIRYGILLWGSSPRVKEILLLQKKLVRVIKSCHHTEPCRPLFMDLNILTVVNLFIYEVLVNIHSKADNLSLRLHNHGYKTRNRNDIEIPLVRLTKMQNSYIYVGPKMYNRLPTSARNLVMKTFKYKLYNWLARNPFYSYDEVS